MRILGNHYVAQAWHSTDEPKYKSMSLKGCHVYVLHFANDMFVVDFIGESQSIRGGVKQIREASWD